ncbi:MAG TPA: hypothetical protein VG267_10450 [Terracidiphilus sp.]|jgi:hypothetical protein|nr:hypothetical protein [Terracidiphilus sp.]
MAFVPIIAGWIRRNDDEESAADTESASDSPGELIALDLSGAHTEAAALAPEPLHHIQTAHDSMPDEESDLTGLNLDREP